MPKSVESIRLYGQGEMYSKKLLSSETVEEMYFEK